MKDSQDVTDEFCKCENPNDKDNAADGEFCSTQDKICDTRREKCNTNRPCEKIKTGILTNVTLLIKLSSKDFKFHSVQMFK